jgi:hypothetical protein
MPVIAITCDVDCDRQGTEPRYRAYVNGELFAERTWIWDHQYLEEQFVIKVPPGRYQIRYESVPVGAATFVTKNWRITHGQAQVVSPGVIEVNNENT